MSYLARLKNLKSANTHTTKTTETLFVVSVAPIPAPFENSRGISVGFVVSPPGHFQTSQITPANDPTPAPALVATVEADWKELDRAYQAHHVNCPTCIAAGKGYGLRCGVGAALWSAYDAVDMPMHGKVPPKVGTATPPSHSRDASTVDQPPLADAENTRNAARLALFDARGLGADDAERLVNKLLTRDREGDRRGVCAECRQLVGNGLGRWRCADPSPTHINELAGANLGAAFVHLNLHRCNSIKGAAS